MVSAAATSLRDALEQKLRELEEASAEVDKEAAARRPAEGEWCVKEVLSHLCGDEGESAVARLRRFVDEETPLIGIVAGLPYYSPKRQAMPVAELLSSVRAQYEPMGEFLAGLSDEQLARKGRVPLLKDSPFGEYPTLAQLAGALINFHFADHVNQIRNSRQ
ncbi:MAG: DinB family protein [Chloroflexi bacterium]|nr:DinB family protein [Chloroflexota bacterium]